MRIFKLLFLSAIIASACLADIINVPDDFETIQTGINVAEDGDTVLVAPGEYQERIDFIGRDIVVGSTYLLSQDWNFVNETTIAYIERNSVVNFSSGETEDAKLVGFTISTDPDEHFRCNEGGGIYCINSDPTIIACKIINQSVGFRGGGIFIDGDCNVTLIDVWFLGNEAGFAGGGAYLGHGAAATFTGCYFYENIAWDWESNPGNAIFLGESAATLNFCTIANSPIERIEEYGYAAIMLVGSDIEISSSIFWTGWDVFITSRHDWIEESSCTIRYSDIENGREAFGRQNLELIFEDNIEDDPLYVDNDGGNHHLSIDSPCIDAGDPEADLDPDGTRADMGVFHFHQRDINVNPLEVQFPPIEWDTLDSLSITISNIGRTDLTIDSIAGSLEMSCIWMNEDNPDEWEPIVIEPLSDVELWIYYRPQVGAVRERTFWFFSNDPDEPEVTVHAEGDVIDAVKHDGSIPDFFNLVSVYPNPFNASTTITYTLPMQSNVALHVYNTRGQLVDVLLSRVMPAGRHSVVWDASRFSAGVYLVRMVDHDRNSKEIRKVVLVK